MEDKINKTLLQELGLSVSPNFRYSSKCVAEIYSAQYENTMLVYLRGTTIWRFHTGLCKFMRNISTNIWSLGKRTGLKLRECLIYLSSITILWFYCVTVKTIYNQFIIAFLKRLAGSSFNSVSSKKYLSLLISLSISFTRRCSSSLASSPSLMFVLTHDRFASDSLRSNF